MRLPSTTLETDFTSHPLFTRYAGVTALFTVNALLHWALSGIDFPSALIGMAVIVAGLVALGTWRPAVAEAVIAGVDPALEFVAHKWLPVFYSPALATLPLAVQPLTGEALAKSSLIIALGVVLTAGFTGHVALTIRRCSALVIDHPVYEEKPVLFTRGNYLLWGTTAAASAGATLMHLPQAQAAATFALLLSSAVLGYMGGMSLPPGVRQAVHPIVFAAAGPNVAAGWVGMVTGNGYWQVLSSYVTKGADGMPLGAGDALFSFLGVIILCFGFKVYAQWHVLTRHRAEVLGATVASAAFSMLSTAVMARAAGLPADLARGLVPRGATLALALPIADLLHAPQALTAAAVALTGIMGANFLVLLLNAFRLRDPISRGLAAAGTAHGMAAAVLAAREPEALPYCALAYALCGVAATVLVAVPPFRDLILAITG